MAWNPNGVGPNGGLPPLPLPPPCPFCNTQCISDSVLAVHIQWHITPRRMLPVGPQTLAATANPVAHPPMVPLPAAAPRPVPAVPAVVAPAPVAPLAVVAPALVAVQAGDGGACSMLAANSEFWKEYRSGGEPPAEIDFLGQWESSVTTPQPLADGTDEEAAGPRNTLDLALA
ncbi:hypothetical protein ZWY2020_018421 [Hordeum vulgare]|nr:hypothetical protein ZWY2020_018421 [Hordeum vulgare]